MTNEKQLPAVARGSLQITTIEDAKSIGDLFSLAGLFDSTTREEAQGMTPEKKQAINAVKIIAGNSLGLNPLDAMKLHIVKGKITIGYQQLLAMIRRTPGYDYRIVENSIEAAEVEFFRNGQSLGTTRFDTADMQRAGLSGDNWRKYPAQMRLSKAVSAGVSAHCPEVTGGPTYTPQDLDDNSDYDLDIEAVVEQKKPASTSVEQSKSAVKGSTKASMSTATSTTKTTSATSAKKPVADEVQDAEVVESQGNQAAESETTPSKTTTTKAPTEPEDEVESLYRRTMETVDDTEALQAFADASGDMTGLLIGLYEAVYGTEIKEPAKTSVGKLMLNKTMKEKLGINADTRATKYNYEAVREACGLAIASYRKEA